MPKAPVHEYGEAPRRKHNIGRTGQIATVKAKPKARRMEGSTYTKLGGRVPVAHPTHQSTALLRR